MQSSVDPSPFPDEGMALDAVLSATRELLWITTPADAQAAAVKLIEALGGVVVPGDSVDDEVLPLDVSFGVGGPLLVWAADLSVARMMLEQHLPTFILDARRALELIDRTQRLADEVSVDPLTGLSDRRMVGRSLGRLHRGDVVVMLDLDDFRQLNEALGQAVGDQVLAAFGRAITDCVRARDQAGRYGGEEFVVILVDVTSTRDAEAFLERLRDTWIRVRPHPVSFSAGIAQADDDPVRTLQAADEAMSTAKRQGRDRWVTAEAPPADSDGQPHG